MLGRQLSGLGFRVFCLGFKFRVLGFGSRVSGVGVRRRRPPVLVLPCLADVDVKEDANANNGNLGLKQPALGHHKKEPYTGILQGYGRP